MLRTPFLTQEEKATEAAAMATDKSVELLLRIYLPELKTLSLTQGFFRLRARLNDFIHLPRFCGFSRVPNRSVGSMDCYVESYLK